MLLLGVLGTAAGLWRRRAAKTPRMRDVGVGLALVCGLVLALFMLLKAGMGGLFD